MPHPMPRRSRRLELRLTPEERTLLEEAALLRTAGDISRMVTAIAVDAARAIIREHETTDVTDQVREEFYAALLSTSNNDRLARLFSTPPLEGYDL